MAIDDEKDKLNNTQHVDLDNNYKNGIEKNEELEKIENFNHSKSNFDRENDIFYGKNKISTSNFYKSYNRKNNDQFAYENFNEKNWKLEIENKNEEKYNFNDEKNNFSFNDFKSHEYSINNDFNFDNTFSDSTSYYKKNLKSTNNFFNQNWSFSDNYGNKKSYCKNFYFTKRDNNKNYANKNQNYLHKKRFAYETENEKMTDHLKNEELDGFLPKRNFNYHFDVNNRSYNDISEIKIEDDDCQDIKHNENLEDDKMMHKDDIGSIRNYNKSSKRKFTHKNYIKNNTIYNYHDNYKSYLGNFNKVKSNNDNFWHRTNNKDTKIKFSDCNFTYNEQKKNEEDNLYSKATTQIKNFEKQNKKFDIYSYRNILDSWRNDFSSFKNKNWDDKKYFFSKPEEFNDKKINVYSTNKSEELKNENFNILNTNDLNYTKKLYCKNYDSKEKFFNLSDTLKTEESGNEGYFYKKDKIIQKKICENLAEFHLQDKNIEENFCERLVEINNNEFDNTEVKIDKNIKENFCECLVEIYNNEFINTEVKIEKKNLELDAKNYSLIKTNFDGDEIKLKIAEQKKLSFNDSIIKEDNFMNNDYKHFLSKGFNQNFLKDIKNEEFNDFCPSKSIYNDKKLKLNDHKIKKNRKKKLFKLSKKLLLNKQKIANKNLCASNNNHQDQLLITKNKKFNGCIKEKSICFDDKHKEKNNEINFHNTCKICNICFKEFKDIFENILKIKIHSKQFIFILECMIRNHKLFNYHNEKNFYDKHEILPCLAIFLNSSYVLNKTDFKQKTKNFFDRKNRSKLNFHTFIRLSNLIKFFLKKRKKNFNIKSKEYELIYCYKFYNDTNTLSLIDNDFEFYSDDIDYFVDYDKFNTQHASETNNYAAINFLVNKKQTNKTKTINLIEMKRKNLKQCLLCKNENCTTNNYIENVANPNKRIKLNSNLTKNVYKAIDEEYLCKIEDKIYSGEDFNIKNEILMLENEDKTTFPYIKDFIKQKSNDIYNEKNNSFFEKYMKETYYGPENEIENYTERHKNIAYAFSVKNNAGNKIKKVDLKHEKLNEILIPDEKFWSKKDIDTFNYELINNGKDFKHLKNKIDKDIKEIVLHYYRNKKKIIIKRKAGRISDEEMKRIIKKEFSNEEIELFVTCMNCYAKNWKQYLEFMPNRSEKELKLLHRFVTKFKVPVIKTKTINNDKVTKETILQEFTFDERQIFACTWPYCKKDWGALSQITKRSVVDLKKYYKYFYKDLSPNEKKFEMHIKNIERKTSSTPGSPIAEINIDYCKDAGILFKCKKENK